MSQKGKGGGPVVNEVKQEVLEKLQKLVESGMIHGVTKVQLEKELGITRQTISKYLDEIYSKTDPEDFKKIYIEFKHLFDRLFREAYKMLNDARTRDDKEKTMKLIIELIRERTKLLENFFQKPRELSTVQQLGEGNNKLQLEVVYGSRNESKE